MPTSNLTHELTSSPQSGRSSVTGVAVMAALVLMGAGLLFAPENSGVQKQGGDYSSLGLNPADPGGSTGVDGEILGEPYHFAD